MFPCYRYPWNHIPFFVLTLVSAEILLFSYKKYGPEITHVDYDPEFPKPYLEQAWDRITYSMHHNSYWELFQMIAFRLFIMLTVEMLEGSCLIILLFILFSLFTSFTRQIFFWDNMPMENLPSDDIVFLTSIYFKANQFLHKISFSFFIVAIFACVKVSIFLYSKLINKFVSFSVIESNWNAPAIKTMLVSLSHACLFRHSGNICQKHSDGEFQISKKEYSVILLVRSHCRATVCFHDLPSRRKVWGRIFS